MSVQLILSLRDVKAELFLRPFFVPTLGVAYRDIASEIARGGQDNQLAMFTSDFELWHLGNVDMETGTIDAGSQFPVKVCQVSALAVPRDVPDQQMVQRPLYRAAEGLND